MALKQKRTLAKNANHSRESLPSDIRSLAEIVQIALAENAFDKALNGAERLSEISQTSGENNVYLTSIIWQIRAHQGLAHDRDIIEKIAQKYIEESTKCDAFDRIVQGNRIIAQQYIDQGRWTVACEYLEKALDIAISHQQGRATLELLMHLSALELKMCHYMEAIDYLSRAMNAISPSGVMRDDMRELGAVGQRQLCELYDTVGDGEKACDALEAAQNANTSDPEEKWLQQLWLSRFDLRSGDADAGCVRLKKIEADVAQSCKNGKSRPEQLVMVKLDRLQAQWNHGEYQTAIDNLEKLDRETDADPLKQAIALMRFQWSAEAGRPMLDPDECCRQFAEACADKDDVEIQISLAAALTQAALEIERGNYEPTLESLLHIAQAASFTQLIPFATRALALRGQICLAQGDFAQAAQDGRDACETFVAHVDDVSARMSAALMLRAQLESSAQNGCSSLDKDEQEAFDQLLSDLDRYGQHHHEAAFLDLGIALVKIAQTANNSTLAREILARIEPHIDEKFMAHRAMSFNLLKGRLFNDETLCEKAREIARLNGFKCQ